MPRTTPPHKPHAIAPIDLLVVNLYPFEETVAKGAALDDCIENIDIGGPAMIRAAAKNHASVTVVVDPEDYERVLAAMAANGGATTVELRRTLAAKAFARTAAYDGAISNYLGATFEGGDAAQTGFGPTFTLQGRKAQDLRYGENAHQHAAFYVMPPVEPGTISAARQLQGKELSYNNIADTDAALECVKQFADGPACVIVKHANPCGVAEAASLAEAYDRAFATDTESAFGGIIAFNRELDAATASLIVERQFVEVIIAPCVASGVEAIVAAKKNVRLLVSGAWPTTTPPRLDLKKVAGGLLVQNADLALIDGVRVVTKRQPSEQEMADLMFTWKVAKFVKSNAIVYGRDRRTIGVGAGQMSRVNSARIAVIKAGAGGAPSQRLGRRVGRVLPIRRRADRGGGSRRDGGDPARRLHARRGGDRGGRRTRARHGARRACATSGIEGCGLADGEPDIALRSASVCGLGSRACVAAPARDPGMVGRPRCSGSGNRDRRREPVGALPHDRRCTACRSATGRPSMAI